MPMPTARKKCRRCDHMLSADLEVKHKLPDARPQPSPGTVKQLSVTSDNKIAEGTENPGHLRLFKSPNTNELEARNCVQRAKHV